MFKVGDIVAGVPPSLSYTWPAQVADISHAPEEIREELDSQLNDDKDSVLLRFLGLPTFEYAVCQEKCVAFIQDESDVGLLDVPRTGKHRKPSLQAIDEVRQLLRQRRQLDTQMHQGTQPVCLDLRDRSTWPAALCERALLSPPRTLTPDECTRTSASSALGNLLAAARGGGHPTSPGTTWDRLVYSRNVAKGKQLLERVRATGGSGADTLHVQRQAGPVLKSRVEAAPAFDLDTNTSTMSSDGWAVNADERPTKWRRIGQGAAPSQGQPSGQLAAAARPLVGAADLGGSSQPPRPRQNTAGRQSAPSPEAPELVLGTYQKQQGQVHDAFETHQSEVQQEPEPQPMGTAADMANTEEWDDDIWDDDDIITRPQQQVESGGLADSDDEVDDEVEDDDVDIALAALLGWSQRDYRGKSHARVQVNGQGQCIGMDLDKLKPSAPRGANQQPEDARGLKALARDGQVAETASPLAAVASRPVQLRSAEPHAGSCAVPTRMQRAPSPAWPPVAADAAAVEELEGGALGAGLGSKRVKQAEVGAVASARVGAPAGRAEGANLSEALTPAGQKDDHKGARCKGDANTVVGAAGTALGSQSQSAEAEETQTSADAISDAVLGSLKQAHSQGSLWRRTPLRSLRAVPLVPGAAPGTRKIASCLSAGTSAAAVGVSLHYAETNVPVLDEGRPQPVAAPTAETASSGLQQPEAGAEPSGEPGTVGDYQKCTEAAGPVDIRDLTYAAGLRGDDTSRDKGPFPVPGSTAADLGSGVHWQAVSELPSRVEGYRGLHLLADDVPVGALKLLRQLARDPVAVMNRNCTPRLELLHNATLLLCREVCFANSHLAKEGSLGHRVEKVLRLAGEWHGAEEEHQRHQQQPQNGNLTAAYKKDLQMATHQQQQSPHKLQKKASAAAVGNKEDVAMGVPHKVRRRDEEALGRGTAKGNYASMAGSAPPADVEPKASAQSDANRGRVARAPSLAADVTTAAGSLVSSGQTKPIAAKGAVSAVPAQLTTGGASLQDEEVVDLAAMEQPLRRIVSIAARNPCSDGVKSGVPLAQQHAATTAAASLHRRPGANPSPRIGGLKLSSFVGMKSTTASRMQPVGATNAVPTARLPAAVRPVGEQALGQAPARAPKQHALQPAQQPPSVIKRPQCPAPIQGGASGNGQLGGGSCERLLIWFGKGVPMPTETLVRNVVMMVIRSDPARRPTIEMDYSSMQRCASIMFPCGSDARRLEALLRADGCSLLKIPSMQDVKMEIVHPDVPVQSPWSRLPNRPQAGAQQQPPASLSARAGPSGFMNGGLPEATVDERGRESVAVMSAKLPARPAQLTIGDMEHAERWRQAPPFTMAERLRPAHRMGAMSVAQQQQQQQRGQVVPPSGIPERSGMWRTPGPWYTGSSQIYMPSSETLGTQYCEVEQSAPWLEGGLYSPTRAVEEQRCQEEQECDLLHPLPQQQQFQETGKPKQNVAEGYNDKKVHLETAGAVGSVITTGSISNGTANINVTSLHQHHRPVSTLPPHMQRERQADFPEQQFGDQQGAKETSVPSVMVPAQEQASILRGGWHEHGGTDGRGSSGGNSASRGTEKNTKDPKRLQFVPVEDKMALEAMANEGQGAASDSTRPGPAPVEGLARAAVSETQPMSSLAELLLRLSPSQVQALGGALLNRMQDLKQTIAEE